MNRGNPKRGGGGPEAVGESAVSVLVGVGSNLGDRRANIRRALELLGAEPDLEVVRASRLLETEPVGGPPQGRYLNGAIELRTRLAPPALLDAFHRIEKALGRIRSVPDAPRELDLDILLYGNRIVSEPGLEIPHPRMLERLFVLVPLCEIAPQRRHPATGQSIREHRERLETRKETVA